MTSYYLRDIYRLSSVQTRCLLLLYLVASVIVSIFDSGVPLLTYVCLSRISPLPGSSSLFQSFLKVSILQNLTTSSALLLLAIVLIIVATLRAALLYLTTRSSACIVLDFLSSYYTKLLTGPYETINFIISKDSVISSVSYSAQFVASYVQPLLILISSSLSLVIILAGVILFLPISNFSFLLGILSLYVAFTLVSQPIVKRLNSLSQYHNSTLIESVAIALENIDSLKISSLSNRFITLFNQNQRVLRDIGRYSFLIGGMPRYFIEIILVVILLITGIFAPLNFILVLIPTFLVIMQRLFPPLQSIYSSLSSIRTSKYIPQSYFAQLSLLESHTNSSLHVYDHPRSISGTIINDSTFILLDNVSYSFKNRKILSNINLVIDAGQRTTIVGPSGSGKSTFIKLLAGLLPPSTGSYIFDGNEINESNSSSLLFPFLSYVPQNPSLLGRTISDCFSYFRLDSDLHYAQKLIDELSLHHLITIDEIQANKYQAKTSSSLSGGERQRLCIFLALISKPKLLLLDEPTSALDPSSQLLLMDHLFSISTYTTVVSITHRMETITPDQMVYKLINGTLIYADHQ